MEDRIFLILSGAYCSPDIIAEYGMLPPAFLPIGLSPIYKLQLELAERMSCKAYLAIPYDFDLSSHDYEAIEEAGALLLRVDPNAHLVDACRACIDLLDHMGQISILFGDTFVEASSFAEDSVAVGDALDYYQWSGAVEGVAKRCRFRDAIGDETIRSSVVAGFFHFSSAKLFLKALQAAKSFTDALNVYSELRPLSTFRLQKWFDVGHISGLASSRRDLLVSRSFNSVSVDENRLTKRSADGFKMGAELNWFKSLPASLRTYSPHTLSDQLNTAQDGRDTISSYDLEYLHSPTLSELYVFGRLPTYNWHHILCKALDFLLAARSEFQRKFPSMCHDLHPTSVFNELFKNKTIERLDQFLCQKQIPQLTVFEFDGVELPPLHVIVESFLSEIRPTSNEHLTIMHGDMFFSNMLYDFRSDQIKIVDPRGFWRQGDYSIYGDWRYDLAKLGHSIYGRYDEIVAGRQIYDRLSDRSFVSRGAQPITDTMERFGSLRVFGQPTLTREIRSIIGLLFLGMLPLHNDSEARQFQLLANGLRIFTEIERLQ